MKIRPESSPAQVDSGAKIIRVKESGGSVYRMKWNGGAYVTVAPAIQVYEDSSGTPATFEPNEERLAVWRSAAKRWETISSIPGEQGEPGPAGEMKIYRFMLIEDMARGDGYKLANLIDLANEPIGGNAPDWEAATAVIEDERRRATASVGGFSEGQIITSNSARTTGATFDATEAAEWTAAEGDDYQVVVVDQEGKFYGYQGYTDPQFGEQTGWIGVCYYTGEDDYDGFGHAGYQILHMEAIARWIEGTVAKDPEASEETSTIPAWSANTYVPPNFKVICPPGGHGGLVEGDIIISIYPGSRVTGSTWNSPEAAFWKKFATPEASVKDYFFLSVDRYWGAYPNNRPPKTTEQDTGTYEEATYYTVKVYCRLDETVPVEGEKTRALYDDESDQYVLAASSGGSGTPHMLAAFVACEEPPDAPGGVFNLPNPWLYTPPSGPDPAVWDPNPAWKIISGSYSHLKILDEFDDPVLVECNDPLFKVPTTGDYCYVVAAAGDTTFELVDRRCGGGGPPA